MRSNQRGTRQRFEPAPDTMPPTPAADRAAPSARRTLRQSGPAFCVKRTFDVVGAAFALALLAPVSVVVAVAIRFTSPGPVVYRSERIGRFERPITVLKFRSMRADADESVHRDHIQMLLEARADTDTEVATSESSTFKLAADDRITPVGRLLRVTSIDELPQLINVLRGEMSLVGPRPELPYVLESYQPWQRRRFDVLPGMTGLWQVSGRDTLSPADMLRLDVDYADRWTLRSDLAILARTLPALLAKFRHGSA